VRAWLEASNVTTGPLFRQIRGAVRGFVYDLALPYWRSSP
jgi:hypothetical protein